MRFRNLLWPIAGIFRILWLLNRIEGSMWQCEKHNKNERASLMAQGFFPENLPSYDT